MYSHILIITHSWKPVPVPDEQCFESIKASLDSVPAGSKMLINSCWFIETFLSVATALTEFF